MTPPPRKYAEAPGMDRSTAEMSPPVEDSDTATVSPRATRRAATGAARLARRSGTAPRIARGPPPCRAAVGRLSWLGRTHLEHSLEEPMGQLDGKVAIVTGSGRGIGR